MSKERKGEKSKKEAEKRTPSTDGEMIVQTRSELHRDSEGKVDNLTCWILSMASGDQENREPAWSPPAVI